jgi:hypothetical protein
VSEGEAMKKNRFTEERIAYALRLAEGGMPLAAVCRQIGSGGGLHQTEQSVSGNRPRM